MKLIKSTKFATAAIAVAAMTTLVSCGDDKNNESLPIGVSQDLQGDWELGRLEDGKTEPKVAGCRPGTDNAGLKNSIGVAQSALIDYGHEFVNDPKCEGKNFLKVRIAKSLQIVSKKDGAETFNTGIVVVTVEVKGKDAVAMLNAREVCGHKDWQEKTYAETEAHLKDCRDNNTERTIIPSKEKVDTLKSRQYKFEKFNQSLAISYRDAKKEDSEFSMPTFFVKKAK